jgi:hypothetical protein
MGNRGRLAAGLLAALVLAGCGSRTTGRAQPWVNRDAVCTKYGLTSPNVFTEVRAQPGAEVPYHVNTERRPHRSSKRKYRE